MCDETVKRFGRIDVLVNNAGIVDQHTPAIRATDELWDTVVAVNLTGTFYFCREALRHMIGAQAGSIVNVSSIAGAYGNGGAAYSASKYGVVGLTKNIAIQYAGHRHPLQRGLPRPHAHRAEHPGADGALRHGVHGDLRPPHRPQRRRVGPADQAEAILYLASDAARYVTGQVLVVDRGMCL